MLKHGFLITAHKDPELLLDILRLLEKDNHYFFINLDKKNPEHSNIAKIIKSQIKHTIFTHFDVYHGGFSQIECTMILLNLAYNSGMDYFHLISGADFPCRTNEDFDSFFEENNGKSYMYFDTEEDHLKWSKTKYPSRFQDWHYNDIKHKNIFVKLMFGLLNKLNTIIQLRSPIEGVRAGWNWFSWHKQIAEYILDYRQNNPKYFSRFKYTSCCDEIVFHTILYPQINNLNINPHNPLRYINWKKKCNRRIGGSPLILNEEEYKEIKESGSFFCRKIDMNISHKLLIQLCSDISPKFELTNYNLYNPFR